MKNQEKCEDRLVLLSIMAIIMGLIMCVMCQRAEAQVNLWVEVEGKDVTLAWDAPVDLEDGRLIVDLTDGTTLTYECALANAITDPDKTNPSIITTDGPVPAAPFGFTLGNTEGKYLVGVRALRNVGGAVVSRSEFAWSDDPGAVLDDPFGLISYVAPNKPAKLAIIE